MKLCKAKMAAALARKDMKQKTLAEKAGVSRSTINGVYCGRSCTPATAEAIAKALEMKLIDLTE